MSKPLNFKEEIFNALTHGLGAALAIAALVLLIVYACILGNVWHIVSFSIFGSTLTLLYFSSTLYHSFRSIKVKSLFRKFDHISIFLLIAGTYTPFCLTALHGWVGWTIFGIVWGVCAAGVVLKSLFTGRMELFSTILYICLGWIIVLAIKPLYDSISLTSFALLVAGGVSYTVGTYFFVHDRKKYFHGIWHMFVLAGSALHFFSVMFLLPW